MAAPAYPWALPLIVVQVKLSRPRNAWVRDIKRGADDQGPD